MLRDKIPIVWRRVPLLDFRRYISTKGLRLAYFGSDEFSVRSLEQLVQFQEQHPDKIQSVDVITRSVKPRGRKSKQFTDLPIGGYYEKNASRFTGLHRVDSKEEINSLLAKKSFDLAVAISFGLLIPKQFLESCRFGGLNVHPSLLPRYSGSSPIQYALLNKDHYTGCTVQTLHPTKFDHGNVVLRSSEIPIEDCDNYASLKQKLATEGASLLTKVIEKDLFVSKSSEIDTSKYEHSWAPKIPSTMANINWNENTASDIIAMFKALGPLYTSKYVDVKKKKISEYQRVFLDGISDGGSVLDLKNPGDFKFDDQKITIKTVDGSIHVNKLKMQCYGYESPEKFYNALKSRSGDTDFTFKYVQ